MSQYLIEQLQAIDNVIGPALHRGRAEAHGDDHLEALTLQHAPTGASERVDTSHAVRVHRRPAAHRMARRRCSTATSAASCVTGPDLVVDGQRPRGWPLDRDPWPLEASVPGVFVAGDVRADSVKRVASAVGEGAMAVTLAHRYLGAP